MRNTSPSEIYAGEELSFNGKVIIRFRMGIEALCQVNDGAETFQVPLKFINQYVISAYCDCEIFEFEACRHVVASLTSLRTYAPFKHLSKFPEVKHGGNTNIQSSSQKFSNLLKTISQNEQKEAFEIFPASQKLPFDEIRYELVLPRHYSPEITINFHTASKLKSGKIGKFKHKALRYKDLPLIPHQELKIINQLYPFLECSRYYESNSFDSAPFPPDEAYRLIDIIKTQKCFTQKNSGYENEEDFRYLSLDLEHTIESKLKINSQKRTLSFVLLHNNKEINPKNGLFMFLKANLILLNDKLHSLSNFIPKDMLNMILETGHISFAKDDEFEKIREELLQKLDHRAFHRDYFNLPVEEKDAQYTLHLRLPIVGDSLLSRLTEEKELLSPPFTHLSIIKDENRQYFEALLAAQTGNSVDANGFIHIPLEKLNTTIETCSQSGLTVKADRAVVKSSSAFNLSLTHNLGWFEVEGSLKLNGEEVPLPQILKKFSSSNLIELTKGELTYIPDAWIEKIKKLHEMAEFVDGKYIVHQSRAIQLEEMEIDSIDLTQFTAHLKNFKSLPDVDIHPDFQGKLRNYQKFSLKWMKFLRELGLGGCLADDMGLGKTVQVAANLQIRKEEKDFSKNTTLIVCPRSLLHNWKAELNKFTPNLSTEIFDGGKLNLHEIKSDILITTYGLLQRNCEQFSQYQFDYVVLDEAQAIKNPRSLTSKAVFTLSAKHRLALTGTPVENHIGELYSIFNFLMPGVYKKAALHPDHENKNKAKSLKPFILRRTKSQVLTDLPDKVEQVLYCQQSPEEARHYNELKTFIVNNLNKEIDRDNFKKNSFMVLEAMTRLRQASCHPGLMNSELKDIESGKISVLQEMLQEIIDEGHKVIIFSQFTTLLKLTREKLNMDDSNSVYLDGSTTKREHVINEFKEDKDKNIFFLSLKAGGTGLNLTEASYCFLLDPWWNPAVEEQAIGRLHRMGQKKSVNVYRLISQGTIEEKVMELQKIKKEIVQDIISDDTEGFIRTLTRKDLDFIFQ